MTSNIGDYTIYNLLAATDPSNTYFLSDNCDGWWYGEGTYVHKPVGGIGNAEFTCLHNKKCNMSFVDGHVSASSSDYIKEYVGDGAVFIF